MNWSEDARASAIALMTGEEREDDSRTATLIRDIGSVFAATGHDRMRTADLLAELYTIEESPWGDYYGKPLSAHGLSKLLKVYRIRTMPVWAEGQTVKGYKVEQFADAFAQLGVREVRTVRDEAGSEAAPNSPNPPNPPVHEQGDDSQSLLPLAGDALASDSAAVVAGFGVKPGDKGFAHELEQARDRGALSLEDFQGWQQHHLDTRRKQLDAS
jgi:hypothetical protein